ncbi:MAG: oligopeptide transporter, OPT family [Kofleriaceae bacterium]|jgi:putative OPT family oligopeptide transporter|nr:oligopeptide transporter, OPT family [Kofleriaceae bacterium]MBP9167665.1 oligopeptide transporter, OPT family [Kofleriaceae bacterium]MBP9862002.1 oligopeptide transporter, OPT family [Kofleriaceae bacterium]
MSEPATEHKPFVPADQTIPELTVQAVVMGAVLGIIFAMSSTYVGLKMGLTVSASIPVAVLSITLFRWLKLRGTILENNIAQTTGSAGESLAAGVAFTLPSMLIMGFDIELTRILLVALLGGLIGVLMMIPLRHGLIVQEHGKLAYPEGTACADVLIVGEKGGTEAKTVFTGFFVGFGYNFLNLISKLWADAATFTTNFHGHLKKVMVAIEVSPPMLGVGYIIGPRVAATMLAGGLLAFVVLIPLIAMFHPGAATMSPGQIRGEYVLYIGAGAVAAGGFISLARSIPTIISAFSRGLSNLGVDKTATARVLRTEEDLSMKLVLAGAAMLAIAIFLAPVLDIDFLTALLVVVFGFFFVTVSSRITGEIGSSSNPISGMTIATLLLTCGLFVLLGRTGVGYKAMALSTAALVCVAASNGGTISQDLKTGYLVGATPRLQQIAIAVGVVTSAIAIGFTLLLILGSGETIQPVKHDGVKLTPTSETAKGPDGQTYKVAFHQETGSIKRGKYLVDDGGAPMFFIESAVEANYPYVLEKAQGKLPEGVVTATEGDATVLKHNGAVIGKVTGDELGIDRQSYRGVELTSEVNGLRLGHYLVDQQGQVVYFARKFTSKLDAPKAQLFALIIDGTLGGDLPWGLVLIGVFIAIILELVGVSALPFAVGLYLNISISGGVFIGGAIRWLVDRKRKGESATDAEFSPGMLMASGLIAGGSIAGVLQSAIVAGEVDKSFDWSGFLPTSLQTNHDWWPMMFFTAMVAALYWVAVKPKAALPTATVEKSK